MKFNSNRLKTWVTFGIDESRSVNGLPARSVYTVKYKCRACVQEAKESDTQTQMTTGSKFVITLIIRDPQGDFRPNNKYMAEIDGRKYQIVYVKPDHEDRAYLRVYCEVIL